ncbi:unnamed protein product [Litomosoides sigmodontis]|uniref:Uncharacterized protein n=1 Tax=Litomosoides sigmodontis TaxID=42156 RepID=A0A3P6VB10_LITSI|nr:unnamed protein product [Litomosoides sigmodontis]
MAITLGCMKELQQQFLEGIVTYCDDRLARIWIEVAKCEREINFAYRSRHFNLGDWLAVSLVTDEVCKITPLLETRVLKIGVAQVKTEVVFRRCSEKIGHGTIIQSKHFNRVAVFSPFTGIIMDRNYRVYVERIPRDQQWNEEESGVYWFVPSNQIPELISKEAATSKEPASDMQLIGPLVGVVVSKAIKHTIVWTPTLGEGICENHGNLLLGRWIEFMAHPYLGNHISTKFRIVDWKIVDPILRCVPLYNDIMLISTIYIPQWPMNNLIVDWIGPITDRHYVLEKAVRSFGVGHMYEVMLKRSKKGLEEVLTWDVYRVLNESKRSGIVCYVDIRKLSALVYIQNVDGGNGRMLRVDLKIFETVPALGDWFDFKTYGNSQFWNVLSAMKSRKLCTSRIIDGQLQVETEVVLTDKISTEGHRVMFSAVLGAVIDDANKLSNISLDTSQKYTVWCTALQVTVPGDPCWRITNFWTLTVKGGVSIKSKLNADVEKIDDASYVGIVVSEFRTGCFAWTSSLGEIICYCKGSLRIGDWIRFWILRRNKERCSDKPFYISKWQKIDGPYLTREENKTAVVTVELMIPENYSTIQLPTLPFFGEVLDRNYYFGANIDHIRGHVIEEPLHKQNSIHPRAVEVDGDPVKADVVTTPLHKQNSIHPRAVEVDVDPVKADVVTTPLDNAELDPVICSMKLLLMSKEVRETIKTNYVEEYAALCRYFDLVS